MKTLSTVLLLSLLSWPAGADPVEVGTVKLRDGRRLENVKVMKVEPDGLRLEHRDGVGKVRMEDLPSDLARRFSLDEKTASAWRVEEKIRQDEADGSRLRAKVREMMEASRAQQEAQSRSQRMSIFDQAKASDVNYASLDEQLLMQIQLWKDAGRDDLAVRFEEDRALLRQQEIARPATAADAEKQALARRVQSLQDEVAATQTRPTTTTLRLDYDRSSRRTYDPYYSNHDTSGYFLNTPSYIVPGPVINYQSPYCPPSYHPTPMVRPVTSVPAPQGPINMGNPIHGAHLYKK